MKQMESFRVSLSLRLVSFALLAATAAACAPAAPAPTASPTRPPTAVPTPTTAPTLPPTASPGASGVVVTFSVETEQYRILLTDPSDIAIAERLLAGEEAPGIPSGLIVRGETGVNTGYSWSIDPDSVEFADVTMEICDGLPSHVEDGTLEGDRYCPWGAEVVDIEPAP